MRPMPAADRAGDSTESTIDHALLRTLATAPPSTDEIEQLRAAHERWLSSGGGLGDGEQHTVNPTSPWQVLTAAGLAHAVYTGPAGRDGQQAVLRLCASSAATCAG